MQEKTLIWFKKNDIKYTGDKIFMHIHSLENLNNIGQTSPDIGDVFVNIISKFISTISGFILATLTGGNGVALIMSGPVGWIIGLVVGSIVGAYVFKFGKEHAKEKIESQSISPSILKITIPKFWINRILKNNKMKFEKKLLEKFCSLIQLPKENMLRTLKDGIKEEINSLSLINKI